jgi:hypothetical protein
MFPIQDALAIHVFAIRNFDCSHPILVEPNPCLCSKSELAIRGFAIHIQIFLEPNPRE